MTHCSARLALFLTFSTPAFTLLDNDGVGHQQTLRALINAGANLQLTERQGNTPLQLAWSRGYIELVLMLMLMLMLMPERADKAG